MIAAFVIEKYAHIRNGNQKSHLYLLNGLQKARSPISILTVRNTARYSSNQLLSIALAYVFKSARKNPPSRIRTVL